jgi:prepilin-type N-terminal cleavage/methylation domain-containing protein
MKTHTTSFKAKFNSAFSLVELLVVIAVIAVIAAVAIPNITGVREAAIAANTSDIEGKMVTKSRELRAIGFTNSISTVADWVTALGPGTTATIAGEVVSIGLDIPVGYTPSTNLTVINAGEESVLQLPVQ